MVKPPDGTNEKVRARILELTGKDPGAFQIKDIFAGPEYHTRTPDQIAEALAQSMVRCGEPKTGLDGELSTHPLLK